MKKTGGISALKKRAQSNFRKYAKLLCTDANGWANCITCKARIRYGTKNCQGGHFDHNRMGNYFNLMNCHAQCSGCNNWGLGKGYEYGKEIDKRYGEGTADKIKKQGRKERRFVGRDGREELKAMNQNYLSLIKEEMAKKNFN